MVTRLGSKIGIAAIAAGAFYGMGCAKNDGALGRAQAQSAGDALGNGIEDSAASFGPVSGGAMADAACVTLSGNVDDSDLDTIPANATLTFDCTAMALGYTGTLTGTESVVDDQPAAIAWAFTAAADLHASLTGPFGGTINRDWSGQIAASQGSAVGPFALDRTLDVVTVFTLPGAQARSTTVTETNAWTVTYTPQASWTPGGVVVTGSLDATGSWNVAVEGHEATATIATSPALTVTPTCATRITAGTITGSFDANGVTHTIVVTWTGCGARTVTFT